VSTNPFPSSACAETNAFAHFMCEYCGCVLWMLAYDFPSSRIESQTDHLVPASRGGLGTAENAVNSCQPCNHKRGNGPPWARLLTTTGALVTNWEPVPRQTEFMKDCLETKATVLRRARFVHRQFRNTVASDWYLNRAMETLWVGATWTPSSRRVDGRPLQRDSSYWARTTFSWAERYRRERLGDGDPPPLERGLVPSDAREWHLAMLDVAEVESVDDTLKLMKKLRASRITAERSSTSSEVRDFG
jgi:hypothetical protein